MKTNKSKIFFLENEMYKRPRYLNDTSINDFLNTISDGHIRLTLHLQNYNEIVDYLYSILCKLVDQLTHIVNNENTLYTLDGTKEYALILYEIQLLVDKLEERYGICDSSFKYYEEYVNLLRVVACLVLHVAKFTPNLFTTGVVLVNGKKCFNNDFLSWIGLKCYNIKCAAKIRFAKKQIMNKVYEILDITECEIDAHKLKVQELAKSFDNDDEQVFVVYYDTEYEFSDNLESKSAATAKVTQKSFVIQSNPKFISAIYNRHYVEDSFIKFIKYNSNELHGNTILWKDIDKYFPDLKCDTLFTNKPKV